MEILNMMHFGTDIVTYLEEIYDINKNSRIKRTINKVAQVKISLIVILIIQIHIREKEAEKKVQK